MDYIKVGGLIRQLRKEKGWTQKEMADKMNISDKTVSKWESGNGFPDVSLLAMLSEIFCVEMSKLLEGDLKQQIPDGGNMKRLKFFVCSECSCIITSTGSAEIHCCGRRLEPLKAKKEDESHAAKITQVEDEYYVTFEHDMTKGHYLSFAAYVTYDRVLIMKLYPEQNAEVRFPMMYHGKLYSYCSEHGLMERKL